MTDLDLMQQLAAQRRNQFAQQSQFQAPQGQMVGRHFVAPNVLQQLAAGLRAVGGMRGQQLAEQELQDISRQRTEGNEKAMAEFLRLAQGTPENAPGDGMGPTLPAVDQNMRGAYSALLRAPDQGMRQAGMQGVMQTAQQQAQQVQQQTDQRRKIEALQTLGPAEAVRQGIVTAQEAEGFANAENIGRAKVARTAEVTGPNGEKLIQAYDQFGQPVGQATPAYMAPVQVNRGDRIEFVSPTAGQAFTIGMSPSERDASARGWASVQQGERRLATEGTTNNRPPAGYRFKPNGDLEPIPGGPADPSVRGSKDLTEAQSKATLYLSQMRDATTQMNRIRAEQLRERFGENVPAEIKAGQGVPGPVGVALTGSAFTNWMAPKAAQQQAQAQRQWAEAYLRAKTGAAATESEVDGNVRTFFPVLGDTPDVIEQKAEMRRQAEVAMESVAGSGGRNAVVSPPQLPSPGRGANLAPQNPFNLPVRDLSPRPANVPAGATAPRVLRFDAQGNIVQ